MKPIVAITLKDHKNQMHPDSIKLLEDAGFEIRYNNTGHWLSGEEHKSFINDVDAIIGGVELYHADTVENAKKLKIIARFGVGMDSMDLPALKAAGIRVGSIVNHEAVAEYAVALMLDAIKKVSAYDRLVRSSGWGYYRTRSLSKMTVGLIGLGKIGGSTAKILQGFGCRILAYSRHLTKERAAECGAEAVSFEELIKQSDIISLHLPATDESRHLIDAKAFEMMKPGAYLVNTARGAVVDEKAMIEALKSGKLAGAALDVFETEPLPADSPLRTMDNVTLTAHTASLTDETNYDACMTCARTVINVLNGQEPLYPVI